MSDDKIPIHFARSLDDMEENERTEAVREMHEVRKRLGSFTLRFMMEAVYGEQYTKAILGESGGDILMGDIEVTTTSESGGLRTTVNEKQLKKIMDDANKGRSREKIKEGNVQAKKLMQDLSEFSPEERETILKFMKKVGEE